MYSVRTTCPHCAVGCGVRAISDGDRHVLIEGDRTHPANQGRLCHRGAGIRDELDLDGRLLEPRMGGNATDWDRAVGRIARRLSGLASRHGADAIGFILSSGLLTEDYYAANKLMKGYIGAANIDVDAGGWAVAARAHGDALGEMVASATYEDIDRADMIVIAGGDLPAAYPVLHRRIMAAREERGTALAWLHPHMSPGAETERGAHLPVEPDRIALLMNGLLAHCDQAGTVDADYLDNHVAAPPGFWDHIRTGHDIWSVARACGLPPAQVKQFYEGFAASPRALTLFADDLGDAATRAILNVHLATGRIAKPGAAPFLLAGSPNAMGASEVGCLPGELAAHHRFGDRAAAVVQRLWGSPTMAQGPGLDMAGMLEGLEAGRIRAIWLMEVDPVADPVLGERWRAALTACPLVVLSTAWSGAATAQLAHVLLPAAPWGERDGTTTNADRLISRQRAIFPWAGQARPHWWMATRVGRAMGWWDGFTFERPVDIYREHARLSAYRNDGERLFSLKRHGPLSNPAYDELTPWRWGETPFDHGHFPTADGRARLSIVKG